MTWTHYCSIKSKDCAEDGTTLVGDKVLYL